MSDETDYMPAVPRTWLRRFGDAFRGVKVAVRAEVCFYVHLFATIVVLLLGMCVGLSAIEWCLVVLCLTIVLAAEAFNTAIERLAKAVTRASNPHVRDALDVASAAVLITAAGAVVVGAILLARPLLQMLMGQAN
jgi:diacylglycerol kinase